MRAIFQAFLAAVFYAVSIPLSKLLLASMGATTLAALLYLGAGLGVGLMSLVPRRGRGESRPLTHGDMPFVVGMLLLDLGAPILLMFGLRHGSPANASLLGNFEIVATTLVALGVFHESVSWRLWGAIALITLASLLLSFDGAESLRFSAGSLLVLLATLCWGFENNCTRKISSRSTYEIVMLKGTFSGLGGLVIAWLLGEPLPGLAMVCGALMLGFVAYGLSIFLYVRAQQTLGAAKTSAYYAVAPFVGAALSFALVGEPLSWMFLVALAVMMAGTALVVIDTLVRHHTHPHQHVITHRHGGLLHTHSITHAHPHDHLLSLETHAHHHWQAMLEHSHNA